MVANIEANLGSDASRRHAAETKETKVLTGQKRITLALCMSKMPLCSGIWNIDEASIPRLASLVTGHKDHLKTQDQRTLER